MTHNDSGTSGGYELHADIAYGQATVERRPGATPRRAALIVDQGRPWWLTPLPHRVATLDGLVLVGATP